MPRPRKVGRDRLEIRANAAFLDAVKRGADLEGRHLTVYVIGALEEKLRRQGIKAPPAQGDGPQAGEGGHE